ncbi:hypothetical protein CRG98_046852 [Punica granatum]|uniref:Secreted protein n=1 Tax=Punica granatum TaxID=22663 RepID=A0A2I0HNB7_PUNGR|nr:hypothetical protein CRG98_046852 [Punica granatum]
MVFLRGLLQVLLYLAKRGKSSQDGKLLPGPRLLPMIGSLLELFGSLPQSSLAKLASAHGLRQVRTFRPLFLFRRVQRSFVPHFLFRAGSSGHLCPAFYSAKSRGHLCSASYFARVQLPFVPRFLFRRVQRPFVRVQRPQGYS